jgi:hypothetical protein
MIIGVSYKLVYQSADGGKSRLGIIGEALESLAEIPILIKQFMDPPEFFVFNETSNDGLTFYENIENKYTQKLLASYKEGKYGSVIDLIDLNSGESIKKWKPNNLEIFKKAYNPENLIGPNSNDSDLYYMHPLMLKDSSLLVTSQISSLLARIDKESELDWLKNDQIYHHSLELDSEGNVYTCTRPFKPKAYSFLPEGFDDENGFFLDDHITKINPETGKVMFDKSVIEILIENGYEDLLFAKGQINSDPVHLNDIQPALDSTAFWHKDDLLVSLRNLSAVMLYRPKNNKVIWMKSGPWYNQHDADFVDHNKILIFGNDVIREESVLKPRLTNKTLFFSDFRKNNNAYLYDFEHDSVTRPYSELFAKDSIRTFTSGRCDLLENGDIFIEETNFGRIIIGDSISKKMEFVKRINEDNISRLFWSRIID